MGFTAEVKEFVKGMHIGQTRYFDMGGSDVQLLRTLGNLHRGKDYRYSVKLDKQTRLYAVKKLRPKSRFKYYEHLMKQVEGMKAGERRQIDTKGKSGRYARSFVPYVARKMGVKLGLNECAETGKVFITQKS